MAIIWDKNLKELVGVVVSDKMEKTVVVSVSVVKMHKLYKKRFVVYKKFYVHDENNEAKEWNKVRIRQISPISKKKKWWLIEILSNKAA